MIEKAAREAFKEVTYKSYLTFNVRPFSLVIRVGQFSVTLLETFCNTICHLRFTQSSFWTLLFDL